MGIPQIRYSFKIIVTYTELCNHDVHQTAHHYKCIKGVPSIYKIVLYNPKQREREQGKRGKSTNVKALTHIDVLSNHWSKMKSDRGNKVSSKSHVRSQSQKFDDHLNSKERSEDHVQDVHNKVEEFGLLIVLWGHSDVI